MATSYIHRLTFVIPAAQQSTINTWIANNVDPAPAGNWFTNGLSASGTSPATYYFVNAALTDAQLATIINKICQLASITFPPTGWSGWTKAQKASWIAGELSTIQSATSIYVLLDDNLGAWTTQATVLATLSLQVIPPGS